VQQPLKNPPDETALVGSIGHAGNGLKMAGA
jgi:hypothetical protein